MARVKKEKKPKVKKPIYKKWWFWLIIAILVIGAFGGGSDTKAPAEDKSATTQESAEVEEKADETKAKEEPSDKTEEAEENGLKPGTDLEIILREGHPTYYGSVEESHKFWKKDGKKKKIIFGDSTDKATENTILTMGAYRDSDLIRDITIDFDHFEENPKYTIDEVLPIAASYMPFDVIAEYYEYRSSRKIVPKEGETGGTYYVITYGLTEEGSNAYGDKKHEYSGSIDVIMPEEDGHIPYLTIGFGTPKWMGFLDKNGYDAEDWKVDLRDYK